MSELRRLEQNPTLRPGLPFDCSDDFTIHTEMQQESESETTYITWTSFVILPRLPEFKGSTKGSGSY